MSNTKIGHLFVVVGPSGAGKDSILKAAQSHFINNSRIESVRRVITRACDPAAELHDSVSEEQFVEQQVRGDFSVWWQANGLYYGLPASVHDKLNQGQLLIANGSRGAIDDIRSRFKHLTVVHITVSEEALRERLERRNRETAEEISRRLERNKLIKPLAGNDVVTIDNSAARDTAIHEFIDLINSH